MSAKYQTTLLLNSRPILGKVIANDSGSSFTVFLDNELKIPSTAVMTTIEVDNATIWYNTPNIVQGVNDTLYVDDNGTPYVVVIETGLYSIDALNDAINREIVNLGGDSNLIKLIGDESINKSIIQYNKVGVQIDFTQSNTFREILGFNSRLSPLAPSSIIGETDTGDNVAAFNQVEYYLIHSDIISKGFTLDNYESDVIARVLIDKTPGKQLLYNPDNPDKITANDLIKNPRSQLTFTLTDQNNNNIDTRGEYWSVKVIIEYEIPFV